ncbi:EcsC family protein [Octadecabacter sp. 1_MG-2023]|uniref:EcsC family protein n=1 Tax=unclassified Octadecabacter TaxID=196158 RepID=UPI001C09C3CE|nr:MULTISPECIES: EcsC family protein [unclassified Octadecabacter]MBU2992031.1 EcsC family protein [Octadecabacter sp. B2R22]MDO6736006.1 EcsC family protein [Octadecabacter sp. 1_MG-2023]
MTADPDTMRNITPRNPPAPLGEAERARIKALAARQHAASGVLMQVVTFLGGQVEDGLKLLPDATRTRLDGAAVRALRASYDAAGRSRGGIGRVVASDRAHKALASVSGAIGGLGGLPTALAELPIATTMIFRAVQHVAETHGEDPTAPETRAQCLMVFGKGGHGKDDDGVDTSFIGARIGLSGAAINKLISKVAPQFATVLGQKLAGQAVPILGAAAGAGTNYTFVSYYTDIAHVHFGLRSLGRDFGENEVADAFHEELSKLTSPLLKA